MSDSYNFTNFQAAANVNVPQTSNQVFNHMITGNNSVYELMEFEDFPNLVGEIKNDSTVSDQNPFSVSSSHGGGSSNTWVEVPTTSSCGEDMQLIGNKEDYEDSESKIAFRTRSDLEVMDDGYKWRKYGKKRVKGSPNPRNYYRCTTAGCMVKKRVQREMEDPRFVITTYEGKHNHESFSAATSISQNSNAKNPVGLQWTPHTLQLHHHHHQP